jgi:glycine/D-amino acid oxidase-like deaminating enzyme
MARARATSHDHLVIGGGFYGCCLALYLRALGHKVVLVEAEPALMQRASRVNQARVHTGFHYPRSAPTAVKSMLLHRRFIADFPEAICDDFQMLYAIARRRSKVTAKKFYRMFRDMGAPIAPAEPGQRALFDPELIEEVFACREVAFDHRVLARRLGARLDAAGVELRLGTAVVALAERADGIVAHLDDGSAISARRAFNTTYAQVNTLLARAGLPEARLKHEIAELALITPPPALARVGVTVMDGPFFSAMPYPAASLHSFTHVRYTPHQSWADNPRARDPYRHLAEAPRESRFAFMQRDAQRYLPCLAEARHEGSLYEVKTVLIRNEGDDGRPILFHQEPAGSRVISILGGKIDNIYDLIEALRLAAPEFAGIDGGWLSGRINA